MSNKVCANQDDLIISTIKDTLLFDATQKKLRKSYAVPYIGWHPVNDKMTTNMPYDVTHYSWGRNVRDEYGIPPGRRRLVINFIYYFISWVK